MRFSVTLRLDHVLKSFPTFQLGPLNFEIPGGKTIALVGPNGAGKTTLFQLLTANTRPDQGKIFLNQELVYPENSDVRRKIGYQSQQNQLPSWVTPREVLEYVASLHQKPDSEVESYVKKFDILSFQDSALISCSYGMQKRVSLAIAFLQDPDLLILDEPFSGLDLFHMKTLEQELVRRKSESKSTILSTHDLAFISKHADLCYFIESGKLTQAAEWENQNQMQRLSTIDERFFKSC